MIDASTIDPATAQEVAGKAKEKGSAMLDAPVSGGVMGAENATLSFMLGGEPVDVERAKPLLSLMGKNIVHCGAVGTGQVAKICNNLVLAISMIGVSEAMNLGVTLGIDPKILAGIFNTSSARCWSSEVYNPVPGVLPNVPSSRGYTGGFGSALMAKDVGLAVAAANAVKAPLPLGGVALQLYNLLGAHGHGGRDFSVVYEFLAAKAHAKNS
jgi:3-hydroxyisobutyrate dehydrogenase